MTDEATNRIIALCDDIQKKLGDDDKLLYDLLEIMFEVTPGDTWWNVKAAFGHLENFFRPPSMTIEEFIEEMEKRKFVLHTISNDPRTRLFTIEVGPFYMPIFIDDSQKICHCQLIYRENQTVAIKKFSRRFTQDTASLTYSLDGIIAIIDKAFREIPIFLVLET